ncbi:MAG: ABC transporter permease subunit [Bauldia sp.]|nr:ABC transporter permease subunit [Bauldia sp.]
MPDWLTNIVGSDVAAWLDYVTNGRHLQWYASFGYTIGAALLGGAVALVLGLTAAALRRSRFLPVRLASAGYANIVRGVPDVLFFLFFPLAFEQALEWIVATGACSVEERAASSALWPPCRDANIFFSTTQYFLLASVTLGIVYGAFASSVIHGATAAVPRAQLEAARAFGMSERQVLWRVQIRQMWIYALPGLSNVWMLLVKSTSLLSLLQINDIVMWADRLGAPNFQSRAGPIHPDWRWRYYLVLLVFYIALTWLSERFFRWLRRRAGRGMIAAEA